MVQLACSIVTLVKSVSPQFYKSHIISSLQKKKGLFRDMNLPKSTQQVNGRYQLFASVITHFLVTTLWSL